MLRAGGTVPVMTPAQKRLRELRDRQSRERGRMAELSLLEKLDVETRAELDDIEKGTPDLERQIRAAGGAVETEERAAVVETAEGDADPDRVELRSRASVGRFLLGAGKTTGAEAELQAELGLDSNQIPLEMWTRPETRAEKRDITPAPSTTGVNLDALRPYVFAPSVVDKLMVEMPMVPSGTYATGTISTAATADAVPKGGDAATGEVPETAAVWTTETTTPAPRRCFAAARRGGHRRGRRRQLREHPARAHLAGAVRRTRQPAPQRRRHQRRPGGHHQPARRVAHRGC